MVTQRARLQWSAWLKALASMVSGTLVFPSTPEAESVRGSSGMTRREKTVTVVLAVLALVVVVAMLVSSLG